MKKILVSLFFVLCFLLMSSCITSKYTGSKSGSTSASIYDQPDNRGTGASDGNKTKTFPQNQSGGKKYLPSPSTMYTQTYK